jgi:hypothetical protein
MGTATKFRKLIVFDLDQTLIDARYEPIDNIHGLSGNAVVVNENLTVFVYLRPHVRTVLQICRGDPQVSIVLFSAGIREYVYRVLEEALLPHLDKTFYFDAIYCNDNLDLGGVKNIGKIKDLMHADKVLLVDDLMDQCLYGAEPFKGCYWYNIIGFDAEEEGAERDVELFELLKCQFFY